MNNRRQEDVLTGKEKSLRHYRMRRQRNKDIRLVNSRYRRGRSGAYWSRMEYSNDLLGIRTGNPEAGLIRVPAKNAYPKRYWRRKCSHQIKKTCNRKYRREVYDGVKKSNLHHKATEFWWDYD